MNSPLVNRPAVPHRNKYDARPGKITRVILHNWAGTSGGDAHLAKPHVKASTNYIVYSDGGIAVQVPEQYRAWTSGGAAADNPSITIETQNSTMGPTWQVTDQALDAIVRLLADIARRYGWGSITPDRLRGHKEFQSTTCPGPYLWARMGWIRAEADKLLRGGGAPPAPGWDGKPIRGGLVTTPYGIRGKSWSTDRNAQGGIHTGEDWNLPGGTPIGTPVYAVADGTVTIADGGALGLMSILRADNGRFYRYCHLKRGSRDPWNGERVRAGQKIGEVGDTGNVTGPHLHLEDTGSAQLWPPQGHRQPAWPVPDSQPTPNHPLPLEDPMPDVVQTRTSYQHPGGGWHRVQHHETGEFLDTCPGGEFIAFAQIHGPGPMFARYCAWIGPDYGTDGWWRGLDTPVDGKGRISQGGYVPGTIQLDLWLEQPGKITVEQQALSWPR